MSKAVYPYWNHNSKREWLKDVRRRWTKFRREYRHRMDYAESVRTGSAYYPDKVYQWLAKFDEMDKLMKEYYKNA